MPGRALRNKFIDRVKRAKLPVSKCYNCLEKCSPQKVPYCITKALIDAVRGDVENGLVFCGANTGRIHEITTVHHLMQELQVCDTAKVEMTEELTKEIRYIDVTFENMKEGEHAA